MLLLQVLPGQCVVTDVTVEKGMEEAAMACTFWAEQQLMDGTTIAKGYRKDNLYTHKGAFAHKELKLVVPASNLLFVKLEKM